MSASRRLSASVAAVVAMSLFAMVAAGCDVSTPSSSALHSLDELPQATDATTTTTTSPTSPWRTACDNDPTLVTASFRPRPNYADAVASDMSMASLREQGFIRVGVDENTLGFAVLKTDTGDIEGFEVDIARHIAEKFFGDDAKERVELVPVVTSEKFSAVSTGDVDMTISANSMSCKRWGQVAFSAEYYTATQKLLVRTDFDVTNDIITVDDLQGRTVCVTESSSSLTILKDNAPDVDRLEQPDRTGCLVALQEGEVDAYFGHDSFLYGMLLQDPNVEIRALDLDDAVVVSHYGIAINEENVEFVRFVNGVLEEMRVDGTWNRLFKDDLKAELPDLPAQAQPEPKYRD